MPFPFLPIRTAHPEGIVLVQASTGKVMLYGDNVAMSDGFYDDCCCDTPCVCPPGTLGAYLVSFRYRSYATPGCGGTPAQDCSASVTVSGSCAAGWSWSGSKCGGDVTAVTMTHDASNPADCKWWITITANVGLTGNILVGNHYNRTTLRPPGGYTDQTCIGSGGVSMEITDVTAS